ncbi:ABC transporter ATP-binding protein [Terrisporobacter sp.]
MDNKNYAVQFKNVSKIYKMKEKNKSSNNYFYALKDISFSVEKGEIVGILGTNGSGKSTVSNILSGIISPDKGEAIINGEQALIAIKSGLNNKLTGIENIEFKGALLGFNKKKIEQIKKEVIEFSELGDYINQPVKSYSSGMKSRLGFSISINIDADIIIIDEALSVGDASFNEKCFDKINELKESGKTIFFVSHSLSEIKKYCTKALWIEGGVFKAYGEVEEVSKDYVAFVNEYKSKSPKEKKLFKKEVFKNRLSNEKIHAKKSNIPYIPIIMAATFISVFTVGLMGMYNLM